VRGGVSAAFASSLLMGLTSPGLFVALAPLAALLPNTPRVVAVTRLVSLTFVTAGPTATTKRLL
jgi:hypothetical protein